MVAFSPEQAELRKEGNRIIHSVNSVVMPDKVGRTAGEVYQTAMAHKWKAAGTLSHEKGSAATALLVHDKDEQWRNIDAAWACAVARNSQVC